MTLSHRARLAQLLALGAPALLLGGAYLAEYGFGLFPCEMCWWQRYPHFVALVLALLSFAAEPRRTWIGLAAVAILVSGGLGLLHAGVEYGWWEGVTGCTADIASGAGSALDNIMNAPLIRCDSVPWDLFGISLAGWNFLVSAASGVAILWLLAKDKA